MQAQQGREHTHTIIHNEATSASASAATVLHHYAVAAEVHNMGLGLYRRALLTVSPSDRGRDEEDDQDLLAEAAMDLYSQAVDSFVAAAGLVNQIASGASCSALSHLLGTRDRARQLCNAAKVERQERGPFHQRLSPPRTAFLAPSGNKDGVLPRRQERLIRRGIQLCTTGGADLASAGSFEGHLLRSVAVALSNMGLLLMLPPQGQTMGDNGHHPESKASAPALEMSRLSYSLLLAASSTTEAHRTNAVSTDESAALTTILALTLLNNSACILRDFADSTDSKLGDGEQRGRESQEREARLCLAEALRLGGQAMASTTELSCGSCGDGECDDVALLPELCSIVAHNVGLVHRDKGEHDMAVYNLRLSMGLSPSGPHVCCSAQKAPGHGVNPAVETLHRIAEIEADRDRADEALAAYHEALGHLDHSSASCAASQKACAATMFRIGRVHHESLGSLDDATMWYREALRVLRRRQPPPSPSVAVGTAKRRRPDICNGHPPLSGEGEEAEAVVLCFLGQANHAMGNLREALVAYRSVLQIITMKDDSSSLDSEDPDPDWHSAEFHPGAVASLLNVVGNLHLRMGDVTEATGAFAEECRVRSYIGISGGGLSTDGIPHDRGHTGSGMELSSSPLQYSLAILHPPAAAAA